MPEGVCADKGAGSASPAATAHRQACRPATQRRVIAGAASTGRRSIVETDRGCILAGKHQHAWFPHSQRAERPLATTRQAAKTERNAVRYVNGCYGKGFPTERAVSLENRGDYRFTPVLVKANSHGREPLSESPPGACFRKPSNPPRRPQGDAGNDTLQAQATPAR